METHSQDVTSVSDSCRHFWSQHSKRSLVRNSGKNCATNLHYCLDIVTTKSDFQLVLSCFVKAPCAVFLSTKGVVFFYIQINSFASIL